MMSSTLLKVEGLTLASDSGNVVRDLSFAIERGEIVALTGQSGSGKTTTGLAILGMLPPGLHWQTGSITWYGMPDGELIYPRDLIQWKKLPGAQIGYIQQDVFGIFDPLLRVGQQMTMIVHEITRRAQSEVAQELRSKMTEVGIADVDRIWNSFPHQLSGGQLQRCQVSIAITIKPLLLIADEPTSAIDRINQVELLDLLAHIRDRYQMAVLCITHEDAVLTYLADRQIALDDQKPESLSEIIGLHHLPDTPLILEAVNLGYAHRFGGLLSKAGGKVSGLSFSIRRGDCLGIIGQSGSGKSTLAQLLVGLLIPDEGYVLIDNHKIDFRTPSEISFLRSKIQLVMQDGRGSLHPNKSIRWLFNAVIRGRKKQDKNLSIDFGKILNDVGLTEQVLDRKESELSGGECLRINIARALLMQPEVLICDESTSSLDETTREGIINLFLSLINDQQMSLILISHDDTFIRLLASEIIVMDAGSVIEKGTIEAITTRPVHPVTKKIVEARAILSGKKPS
jgi:peptide/nickel transport system ATP-binding protein